MHPGTILGTGNTVADNTGPHSPGVCREEMEYNVDSDKGCEEKESRLWGERLGVALWIEWLGKAPVRRWNLSRDVNKAMDGAPGLGREEHCGQGEQQV